jgi:hypothetical protein
MTLVALQHLVRSAQTLAEDCHMLICGSASLLASFPDLGGPAGPLTSTFDADICPEPFDELTGRMLDEALGEKRAYCQRHGYHADILRDSITQTFPAGWRDRLIPVPDVENAHALDPHDLAAIKILVGRPKDLALVSNLNASLRLDGQVVEKRLYSISMSEAQMVRASVNFRAVFDR